MHRKKCKIKKTQKQKARKSKNAFACPKFKLLLDFV